MKISFSLSEISKTGNLDANLISRQNKLDLMARFLNNKSFIPKLKQTEIGRESGISCLTLERRKHKHAFTV